MMSHNPKHQCEHCETVFWTKVQLEGHVKENHKKEEPRIKKQYITVKTAHFKEEMC